jgi:hypothetical protein
LQNQTQSRFSLYAFLAAAVLAIAVISTWVLPRLLSGKQGAAPTEESGAPASTRTVTGRVQTRPGGPLEEAEINVHEVPVDLPSVEAAEVSLEEDELVLGVVVEGQAMAYPIRYLALHEVVNNRVGETPLAPTW